MSVFDSSLSLSAQDPNGNSSWEGSSCLGEAPQEFVGFTSLHLSPCPLPRAMCSGKLQTGLLVGSYFVYLLVGAAVFQALERTAEKQQKMAAAQMKEAFLQNFTHLTVAEMEQFMKVGAIPVEALSPAHFPIRCCFLLLKMLFLLECSCGLFLQAPNPLPGLRRQIIPICTQIQVDVV